MPDKVPSLNEIENEVEIEEKGHDHPALDVYDNYRFNHDYDTDLPITEHREWVIGTIESNQVTIIQGIDTSLISFCFHLFRCITKHSVNTSSGAD